MKKLKNNRAGYECQGSFEIHVRTDFEGLVAGFDAARAPLLNSWAFINALLDQHLGGSDLALLGGDLAYEYARFEPLSGSCIDRRQPL